MEKTRISKVLFAAARLFLTLGLFLPVMLWMARDAYWSLLKDQYRELRNAEK